MFYSQGNAWRRKPVPRYRLTLSGDIVTIIRRLSILSRDNVSMSRNRRTHTFTPRVEFEFLNFKILNFERFIGQLAKSDVANARSLFHNYSNSFIVR